MNEHLRVEFEKWARENFFDRERWSETYRDIQTRCAWSAWKASRETIIIKPPMATFESFDNSAEWLRGFGAGSNFKEGAFIDVIEAAGIRVISP